MTDPTSVVDRRCALLLRLATQSDERGDARQARELYAYAVCEARRSGRADLMRRVKRAGVLCGASRLARLRTSTARRLIAG